jgi:MFS superfamily sulfate permease-like transporter
MSELTATRPRSFLQTELTAGLVVFLVALPLCLGVALASNAPLFSGILAGIVGGILVGAISGSPLSVSGPAAGLTAIVSAQIGKLGTFENFLAAVMVGGAIQLALGLARCGFIAAFFPSSVIKGLLAAIGLILCLKQIPHVLGHDRDPDGEMAFIQPDGRSTFSELVDTLFDFQEGALVVGVFSVALLVLWNRSRWLKRLPLPAPLVVVVLGAAANHYLKKIGGTWSIEDSHLLQVPKLSDGASLATLLNSPNWDAFRNPAVYVAGVTIALVASLETLLNLEAVDKLDPQQRSSPPNRELIAQGIGNLVGGLIGALPVTSVIVRSSVNVNAGARSQMSTIVHGLLMTGCVLLIPNVLNQIPLSALGAILLVTGVKLASPSLFRQMWEEGRSQFIPFLSTVLGILLTDLIIGTLLGLATSIGFLLHSNLRRPLRRILEKHPSGEVLRIELANQVSFLSKAALEKNLREIPRGGHVLLDARNTDYIDGDILDLIHDFQRTIAPAHGVQVSMLGFREMYPKLQDRLEFADFSSKEVQRDLKPSEVVELLKAGNERFRKGQRINRDLGRQMVKTAAGQYPTAVVVSCIDSRAPAELLFDVGLGDIFCVRVAGNVAKDKVIGSVEYACGCAGARLVVVMGHSFCGAVGAAINLHDSPESIESSTGCGNLGTLLREIQMSISEPPPAPTLLGARALYADKVSRKNVRRTLDVLRDRSSLLRRLEAEGSIVMVGAFYDIETGLVTFMDREDADVAQPPIVKVEAVAAQPDLTSPALPFASPA